MEPANLKLCSGAIGKASKTCKELPINIFELIEPAEILCFVDPSLQSIDQKYLIEIYYAVTSVDFPKSLINKNLGNMSHVSWLTTANQNLRVYVGILDPQIHLKC